MTVELPSELGSGPGMHFRSFALEWFFARYEFSVRHVLCASDCRRDVDDPRHACERWVGGVADQKGAAEHRGPLAAGAGTDRPRGRGPCEVRR